jgi:hypothetical protein
MTTAKKLTNEDFNQYLATCDRLSGDLANNRGNANEALTFSMDVIQKLTDQYDPNDVTAERRAAMNAARELKKAAASELPPICPVGSEVDGAVAREVLNVRKFIRSMNFTMDDEKKGIDLINGLYLDQKTGVRKIEKDHEIMKAMWNDYYARKLNGASVYANGNSRTATRDAKIVKSLLGNRNKYNQEILATVLSKLGHVE